MKTAIALAAAALAATPLAAAQAQSLPGISDEETTIPSGGVDTFEFGKGDVLFVRHRTLKWYRVEITDGCMRNSIRERRALFDTTGHSTRIDRFTRVIFPDSGRICRIESIRRSETPPQYDSDSRVTLD